MQRVVRALLAVGMVALVTAPRVGALPPRRPLPDDALVSEGTAKLEAGDSDAAITLFRKAEAVAPKDPRPRYLRGAALAKSDPEAAIAAYREALSLDATLSAVHAELGALLMDRGKLDDALVELKAALKFDPQLGDAWSNIARLEGRRGHAEAALAAFVEAEKLSPKDVDLRVDHAMALRKAGRHEEAVRLAREAAALDGKSAAAQQALGFTLQSAGKLDEAVAAFTAATRMAPDSASAHWALGVAQRDRKHLAEAIASLKRAVELKATPSILEDLAMTYLADKQPALAHETVRTAAARSPRSMGLRLAVARVALADKRCPEAAQALEGLPPDEPAVRAAAETLKKSCPTPAPGGAKGARPTTPVKDGKAGKR